MRRVDGWGHTPYSVRLAFSAQIERYLGPSISSPAAMRWKAIIATDATVDNRSSAVLGGEEGAEETRGGAERDAWKSAPNRVSGLQGCSDQIGMQGSRNGCTASSSQEAVTECATALATFSVFSRIASRVSRVYAVASPTRGVYMDLGCDTGDTAAVRV